MLVLRYSDEEGLPEELSGQTWGKAYHMFTWFLKHVPHVLPGVKILVFSSGRAVAFCCIVWALYSVS
jgi:hypothetical protein